MRFIFSILLAAACLWCAAFIVVLSTMARAPASPEKVTDALVVLTGGNARVERGFSLLAEGAAPILFISGVGKDVTMQEMLKAHATPNIRAAITQRHGEIVFDYHASTTQTNASEAARFIRARKLHSIRLITAHYHMARSMVEFQTALPEVEIIPEPVQPDRFANKGWWNDTAARQLVIQEVHKYIAARLRILWRHAQ